MCITGTGSKGKFPQWGHRQKWKTCEGCGGEWGVVCVNRKSCKLQLVEKQWSVYKCMTSKIANVVWRITALASSGLWLKTDCSPYPNIMTVFSSVYAVPAAPAQSQCHRDRYRNRNIKAPLLYPNLSHVTWRDPKASEVWFLAFPAYLGSLAHSIWPDVCGHLTSPNMSF